MSFLTYDGYETTQILVKLHFQCEFYKENIDKYRSDEMLQNIILDVT